MDELHERLPSPNDVAAPRIVDIGAGLGMYHIYVDRRYGGRAEHFLVDKSLVEVHRGNLTLRPSPSHRPRPKPTPSLSP
eukprot:scaffold93351_cov63-Phaeocystis_antarctica.AAC.1